MTDLLGTLSTISLHQPYASLIAVGAKPWETRGRAAPKHLIGKRIAIHAALKKPTLRELDQMSAVGFYDAVADEFGFCTWHERIPYGAVVCTAVLRGAYQVTHWNEQRQPVLAFHGPIENDGFGDYAIGRWAWGLDSVQSINPAIPARGAQGWFKWQPPAAYPTTPEPAHV